MKRILIASLLAVLAAPAIATDYVGVNIGDNNTQWSGGGSNTSSAFGLLYGRTLMNNFAAEAAYTNLGSPGGSSINAYSASGVYSLPLANEFSLYGKLGLAAVTCTNCLKKTKFREVLGIGAQYKVNQQIGIRLGYDTYRVSESSQTDVISIGGVYSF